MLKFSNHSFKKALHIPLWLGIVLICITLLRLPSFFEPFFYGDEMIYLNLGEAIRKGLVLYKDVHDNKPPLLYFLASLSGNLFWFRAILLIWMLATTVLFWKLVTRIFTKNTKIAQVATIIFAILTTLPLLEGNIANAEIFMIGFSIIGFLFLIKENLSRWDLIFGGIAFSVAALFKIPAAFELPVIIFYWLIVAKSSETKFKKVLQRSLVLIIAFIVPILLTFGWYALRGALPEYFIAGFAQNFGYLSSWKPNTQQLSFIQKNGPLMLRGVIVLVGILLLWVGSKKTKLSKGFIFAVVWLLFALFAVTLSERPYPHYLIQAVPAVSILVGILIASTRIEQVWTIIPLSFALLVPIYFKFYYYDSFSYYARFAQFATGQMNKWEYFNSFDKNTQRNYQIGQFLQESSAPEDSVFVWGDSPTIYAISKRLPPIKFVATYHINDFSTHEETIKALKENQPKFIVVLPDSANFVALDAFLVENYVPVSNIDGAQIWYYTSQPWQLNQ